MKRETKSKKKKTAKRQIKDAADKEDEKRGKQRISHICSCSSDDSSCLYSWYMCEHTGSLGDFETLSQEIHPARNSTSGRKCYL